MRVDISLPKDLRSRRRNVGYAAILVVGFDADPGAVRIDAAEDVEKHIYKVQPGTWHPLLFRRVVWTPGIAVARTIVSRAERFLADTGHELGQHWYRVGLDVIDDLLKAEAVSLGTRTWSHAELIEKLRHESNAEADRFAAGIF